MSSALFEADGGQFVPTDYARGPWRPDALHGGAVAALLAGALDPNGRTVARLVVDLLSPVPYAPLTLTVGDWEGGVRVARRTVELSAEGRTVATATGLGVRRTDLQLPVDPAPVPEPFAGAPVPDLGRSRLFIAEGLGYECFDSHAVAVRGLSSSHRPPGNTSIFLSLLVDVVAGQQTVPLSRVAAAADYASNHVSNRLSFERWSHMNAELTVHLSREQVGAWVGLSGSALVADNGCGITVAGLYDERGALGQCEQVLVVEAR